VASAQQPVAGGSIAPPITGPVSASNVPANAAGAPVVALPTFNPSSTPAANVAAPMTVPEAAEPPVADASPPPSLGPDEPDERVTAFVESIRVMGIRSSGTESRVLMNERVYRVN